MKEFIKLIRPTKFKIFVAVIIFFLLLIPIIICSFEGIPIRKFSIPNPSTAGIEPTPDPYAAFRIGAEMNSRAFPCGYLPSIVYQVLDKLRMVDILLISFLTAYFIAIFVTIRKGKTKKGN